MQQYDGEKKQDRAGGNDGNKKQFKCLYQYTTPPSPPPSASSNCPMEGVDYVTSHLG